MQELGPLKLPLPDLLQLTVPVGVLAAPVPVSVTVARHVVAELLATGFGVQVTVVLVGRPLTVGLVTPLLVVWSASPP
jgi:hypothetical protein